MIVARTGAEIGGRHPDGGEQRCERGHPAAPFAGTPPGHADCGQYEIGQIVAGFDGDAASKLSQSRHEGQSSPAPTSTRWSARTRRSRSSPRAARDFTVPRGRFNAVAVSASDRSSR